MPKNFITVTTANSRHGSTLISCVDALSQALGRLSQLKSDMDNMTDNVDWTTLESAFGLAGTGKGQTVYNLVAGAVADTAASANLQNLINWLGALR